MRPRGARRHRHGDEDHLGELLIARAGLRGPPGMRVDAPRALRDVRDAERDELLALHVERAGLERFLVELEKRAVRLGRELAHALEAFGHLDAVKLHSRTSI